tara:strand:+ start:249 stop:467 length:219 start_codon:yes stop_codon:yes gene_type:complete
MSRKFGTALQTFCNDNNILYRCLIDGTVETEEQFNNQIVWYTGQADSEGMAIVGIKPNEITWTAVKAEMDKL